VLARSTLFSDTRCPVDTRAVDLRALIPNQETWQRSA
jgi:hypothetical protein